MLNSSLPKTLFAFMVHFVKQQRVLFGLLALCHLAWAVDNTVLPYAFKMFLDGLVEFTGDRNAIWAVITVPVVIGASLWVIVEVMFRLHDYIAAIVYPRFEASIRMAMVAYVQEHSNKYFADNFAGSIANKINDMPQSASALVRLITTLFLPSLVAMVTGAFIFTTMHPYFALLLIAWVIMHMGIAFYYAKECSKRSEFHSASRSELSGRIVDSFSNIVAIKSFARQVSELAYLQTYQNDEQQKHTIILKLVFKIHLLQATLCFVLMGVVQTWLLVSYWQAGVLSPGDVTYIFYTSWSLMIMAWISGVELPHFFKEIGTCKQALRLIQKEHDVKDVENAPVIKVTKGEIVFDNVTFHYRRGVNVFEQKSVTIKPGQKVGLVGFSGSGKTTFVNLILRFYDIESGAISVDHQNIAGVTRNSLRKHISMIPQDPTLFHRTLMDNIRYGNENANDEQVIAASKRANCHEFIMQLEGGYDALVGERGVKLSGGQRQRIAIARAMLKDAPILIMDEATSALDSVTEKLIQQGFDNLMQGRTTILIAHRLSTLAQMDRILVFDQGHIIEDGTHEQLLKANKHYAKLWNMQAGGFLPEKES